MLGARVLVLCVSFCGCIKNSHTKSTNNDLPSDENRFPRNLSKDVGQNTLANSGEVKKRSLLVGEERRYHPSASGFGSSGPTGSGYNSHRPPYNFPNQPAYPIQPYQTPSGGYLPPSHNFGHSAPGYEYDDQLAPHTSYHHPEQYDFNKQEQSIQGFGFKKLALKKLLLPFAGIAILGAVAALSTNPVLLQLGVINRRKRRSTNEVLSRNMPNLSRY